MTNNFSHYWCFWRVRSFILKIKTRNHVFNHNNLQYFMTIHVLNWHQVWWALSFFQFQFIVIYDLGCQQRKFNILSCCSYLIHREGDVTYNQQCDIFKLEHLWIQVMFIILNDKFFKPYSWGFGEIPLANNIKDELKESYHVQILSNEHDNFKFQDWLLYHNELLYVLDGLAWFQILQPKRDTLNASHFGYHKLVSWDYWCPRQWKYAKGLLGHVMFTFKQKILVIIQMGPLAIGNLYITLVFNFHGLHHKFSTFQFTQFHFNGGVNKIMNLVTKDQALWMVDFWE